MAVGKSVKESRLNYTIQPFVREFLDVISFVQMLAENDLHVYLFLNHFCKSDNISAVYYAFDAP
jgi:hypothetical protein